ncbi:hypothetical protein [Streptomyces prunicolor]|uniref:hypothetical protein n=1 Tax=Streptomyces prunicolor TaxID=67348 RepID=UPI001319E5BA|nr:hypothetical protein [Streptomyces prunicolor]
MVELVIAAVGCLVGLGGLAISYAAHRHQVGQAERLAEREQLVAERERAADERNTLVHASRLHVGFMATQSPLTNLDTWVLRVINYSSQPMRDLVSFYGGERLEFDSPTGHLSPGVMREARIPSRLAEPRPLHEATIVEFTDAAGLRWRRLGSGVLQCRRDNPDGSQVWGPEQAPLVEYANPDAWARRDLFMRFEAGGPDLDFPPER